MKRVIVSGGGTGGHIYPAVAVAEALRRRFGEEVEILFVGAEGKMEMEKVPALGYRIVGLPVAGLQRRFDLKNLAVPFKVLKSIRKARRTIRDFGADVVVGFGGYASGPVRRALRMLLSTLKGTARFFKSKRRCKPATGRPTIRYPNAGTFSISILPSAPTKRISTSSPKRRRSASATATAG
jgi:UDP:flavonoid glycosyltransferase YjiC (YdhE family)